MDIPAFMALQDWGSVPDWLAAVGTIAAVGYALRVGFRDHKRLENERREAAEDRKLFRQEQAQQAVAARRRLAAQVTVVAGRVHSLDRDRNGFEGPGVKWEVHNGGDEPISLVALVQRPIPSESEAVAPEISEWWPVIEAGGSREIVTRLYGDNYHPNREVQFTDGTGARWQRKSLGGLRELLADDPEMVPFIAMQA